MWALGGPWLFLRHKADLLPDDSRFRRYGSEVQKLLTEYTCSNLFGALGSRSVAT